MMFGSQYQSTMKYTYHPADGDPDDIKTETITDIPRYGDDINQIIMLGTPQKGSFWSDFGHDNPALSDQLKKLGIGKDVPDHHTVGVEQLQESGSKFMEYFWENKLNQNVTYINLAEDRIGIEPGDGVVSFDSAKGVPLHQQRKTAKRLSDFGIPTEQHTNLYKSVGVKKQILQEIFDKFPITAQIRISRESPVREGAITVYVTTSEPLPSPPKLYVHGWGEFGMVPRKEVALSGSGKSFSGTLHIPKGTDGEARLYFDDKTQIQVKILSENCSQETIETIDVPITGEFSFLIDTEEPEVKSTSPANGEVIIAEEVPYKVNISATLIDPPINGYKSGIDKSTIKLHTPQGTFKQASAVNNLDYGEYTCSIEAKDNANEPGHDLKQSPYRWNFSIVPPIFVSVHPTWQNFTKPHESHTHYITITNKAKNKSFTANIEMRLIKASGCLFVTQYPDSTLELPPNSQKSTSFVVTSGAELIPDDNLIHKIIVSVPGIKLSAIQYANGQNIVTDHPDESYDISDPRYPTPAKIDSEAEVGVYLNGFVDGVAHLLGRFKEPVWFINEDFEPLPTEITTETQRHKGKSNPQITQIINKIQNSKFI